MSGENGDVEPYYIPRHLDDPERWMFWTLDEAGALIVPFTILAVGYGYFLTGMAASLGLFWTLRKLKGSEQPNIVVYGAYWIFPRWVMRLKGTPDSAIREYVG